MRRILIGMVGVAALALLTARPAAAETITFNVCNISSLCGHMTLTTSQPGGAGTAVNVTLNELGGEYGIFGDSGANLAFGFNVLGAGTGLTITNIAPAPPFYCDGPDVDTLCDDFINQGIGGGFGTFEQFIVGSNNGGGAAILPMSFTLNQTGGFASASIADIFEKNAGGFYFAAHLAGPLDSSTGGCSGNCVTGFVGYNGTPNQTTVPEPTTMLLLGSGLLAAFRSRRA